jgi:hypothetical protein
MRLTRRQMLQRTAVSAAGLGLGWFGRESARAEESQQDSQPNPRAGSDDWPEASSPPNGLDLPDVDIVSAYERAARQNVLAALDPTVFFGYWSVCGDGVGFGHGNTFPSLDGHQLSDALLWLDQLDVVKANWDYVRSFQKPNGRLPLAILPGVHEVYGQRVESNGGFYTHWVPGDPLRALGSTTYIQNADLIFRFTQDHVWLKTALPSVNLAGEFLASLTTADGLVQGGGYYLEMPSRLEFDGVAQCHAADAFRRLAALNRQDGNARLARRYDSFARRIARTFRHRFWTGDHFAEYIHPQRGAIDSHGLTDTNWAALATGVAGSGHQKRLWPQLRQDPGFRYGGMPTGIATRPERYEDWEFTLPEKFSGPNGRHDVAAMGRVWYLEAWARARQGDADGVVETLRQVSQSGRDHGYLWRERYYPPDGQPAGPNTYCEYPANLIRIVHRFLLGVDLQLDGSVRIAPTVPARYWNCGFGQTLSWRGRRLTFRCETDGLDGSFLGAGPLRVAVRLPGGSEQVRATFAGAAVRTVLREGFIQIELPSALEPCPFRIWRKRDS